MDTYALLRTFGGLALVLGLLWGALWLVRRLNLRLPGHATAADVRRLGVVERTALDAKRSVALLRRDGREHLILLAPEGHLVIESAIRIDAADRNAQEALKAEAEARRREREEALTAAREELSQRAQAFVGAFTERGERVRALSERLGARRSTFARLVEARPATAMRDSEAA